MGAKGQKVTGKALENIRRANRDPENRRKHRETLASKSPEEKAESSRKKKEAHARRSPGEKAESTRKRLETLASKSPEEKAESNRKRTTTLKVTFANRSPQVEAERGRKISATKVSKSPEEKAEIIRKWSESIVQGILEGRINPGMCGTCGKFFSQKNGKELPYRSQLELAFYKLLEQLEKVKAYRVEPLSIPYTWNDAVHYYIPDLLVKYVDSSLELVEVKPEYMLSDPQTQAKLEAGRKWCSGCRRRIEFKVWSYKDLNCIQGKLTSVRIAV